MMKRIVNFFKSDILWKQIIGTLVATGLIWFITIIIGLIKGLDYSSSFLWTLNILNSKISFIWFILIIIALLIYVRRGNSQSQKCLKKIFLSKDEIYNSLEKKQDKSSFESFLNVYDYRRLKNHPWHEMHINDGVESFIKMIEVGIDKNDYYKIENGIRGLTAELKERDWFHGSEKNKLVQLLNKCYQDSDNHYKKELEEVIKVTRVL